MVQMTGARAARRVLAFLLLFAATGAAQSHSLQSLLEELKSPDADVRRGAAREIGRQRIRSHEFVDALAAATRDTDRKVREEAVRSLGIIKDFNALPEMVAAVGDPNHDVRLAAIKSLVMLYLDEGIDFVTNRREGWNRLNPFLDTDDRAVIEPYEQVEPSIIDALGAAVRDDGDARVRVAAARALGVLCGRGALTQLGEAVGDDPIVRIDAIRAFIKIGDPAAGQYLVPLFRDEDRRVRTQAMVAAGLLKYTPAVEPLMSVYGAGPKEKNVLVRAKRTVQGVFEYLPPRDEAALWALALIGDPQSEQVFVENMHDKRAERRQYAFEGLARLGDQRYLDQTSRLILTEKDEGVRLAQNFAMYKMGDRTRLHEIVRRLKGDHAEQVRDYLLEVSPPSDLYIYIRADDKEIRRRVIEILSWVGDETTIPELRPYAQAASSKTTDIATLAIKRIEYRTGQARAGSDPLRHQTRPRRTTN